MSKTSQGHRTKLNKTKTNKKTEVPTVSSCEQTTFATVFFSFETFKTGWRGGLVVGRRTCDLVVAGSRPGRDATA